MPWFYCGLNTSPLFSKDGEIPVTVDNLEEIKFPNLGNIEISWNYLLLRDNKDELYISGVTEGNEWKTREPKLLRVPEEGAKCKVVAAGKDYITIVTTSNNIWRYMLYEKKWNQVRNFMPSNDNSEHEYIIKLQRMGKSLVTLTNLGRIFNAPLLVDSPKRTKFIDIACGFDHTILLDENGNVYSMGMGTRGQLGHNDLENQDEPSLIEALAGLKVVEIAAAGWHNAVVTDQGDLYTWGWNVKGQLGVSSKDSKIFPIPTPVELKINGQNCENSVTAVQCGNTFTICKCDDGTFWASGSNKYKQLGPNFPEETDSFQKLDSPILGKRNVKAFKCSEYSTVFLTD